MYIKNNKGPTHCFLLHTKSVINNSKSVSILFVFILSSNFWWSGFKCFGEIIGTTYPPQSPTYYAVDSVAHNF